MGVCIRLFLAIFVLILAFQQGQGKPCRDIYIHIEGKRHTCDQALNRGFTCEQIASACCATCKKRKTGIPSCPYGDGKVVSKSGKKVYSCAEAWNFGYPCTSIGKICCAFCGLKKTGNENCPYGDSRIQIGLHGGRSCDQALKMGYSCTRLKTYCCDTCSKIKRCRDRTLNLMDGPHTCAQALNKGFRCEDVAASSCCATCEKRKTGIPSCPYGDGKVTNSVDNEAYTCAEALNMGSTCKDISNICCETCALKRTGNANCSYGDSRVPIGGGESLTCDQALNSGYKCTQMQIATICCDTCAKRKTGNPSGASPDGVIAQEPQQMTWDRYFTFNWTPTTTSSWNHGKSRGCKHGDFRGGFLFKYPDGVPHKGHSCKQIFDKGLQTCNHSVIAEFCCGTCRSKETGNETCPYGDNKLYTGEQVLTCEEVLNTGSSCTDDYIYDRCCATCNEKKTNDETCPFGDSIVATTSGESLTCAQALRSGLTCSDLSSICCITCKDRETGDPECPYGDNGVMYDSVGYKTCAEVIDQGVPCTKPYMSKFCCATCKAKMTNDSTNSGGTSFDQLTSPILKELQKIDWNQLTQGDIEIFGTINWSTWTTRMYTVLHWNLLLPQTILVLKTIPWKTLSPQMIKLVVMIPWKTLQVDTIQLLRLINWSILTPVVITDLQKVNWIRMDMVQLKMLENITRDLNPLGTTDEEAVDLSEHLYNKSVYLKKVPAAEGVIQRPVVTWRGHSYVLSEPIFNSNPASAHFCKSAGGYLLEIDDKLEFDFAVDLMKTGKGRIVLISGTDARHEGNWTFQRTGKPLPYLEWGPREPNNAGRYGEDCLNLSMGHYQMNDLKCRGKWRNVRFICEFPFWAVNGKVV